MAPEPVGRVHFQEPRAQRVRTPGDVASMHSAVYAPVAIYTDTKTETDAIIAAWGEIVQAVHLKVEEIIGRAPFVPEDNA